MRNSVAALSSVVMGGGRGLPFPLNLFTGGGAVAIARSGTDYKLHQEFIGREAVTYGLNSSVFTGGTEHSIVTCYTGTILNRIDDTAGTPGGAWSTANNATYWGGSRQYTSTAGRTMTFVLPAYATDLYWKVVTSNAGIVRISINGSYTAANLTTTAQQLVDAGYLDAAALVANGGTLNPTDRCFDPKTNTSPTDIPLASGLPGGSTVVYECTGYKNPTSSSVAVYIDAVGVTCPMVHSNWILAGLNLAPLVSSVFELANNLRPDGAAAKAWVGNAHGYENQVSLKIYIDGVETAPADGSFTVGSEIKAVRVSEYFHPETGATVIADVTTTYTLKPTGLDVETAIVWAVGGVNGSCRGPMFPLSNAIFDKGATELSAGNYVLTANDNSTVGNDLSKMVWEWDADGTLGALLTVPAGQSVRAQIEDRSGATLINKIYFDKCIADTAFSAHETWIIKGNYRLQRFANADTSLAK